MNTAFDLEQDILRCWNVVEDIGEVLDDVESGHMEIHEARWKHCGPIKRSISGDLNDALNGSNSTTVKPGRPGIVCENWNRIWVSP